MCAIVGIQGENIQDELRDMLKTLKHRGRDGCGVFSGNKVLHGELDEIEISDGGCALGHNLLSIVGDEGLQPMVSDRFTMVCNGEIYNYRELKRDYSLPTNSDSDCEVILSLLEKFYQGSLLEAVEGVVKHLDGDYAFAIYDGENLAVLRDPVGVKPVYYGLDHDRNLKAFASERKALWQMGIRDVETLPPGHVLYNWEKRKLEVDLKAIVEDSKRKFKQRMNPQEDLKTILKEDLKESLISSVEKRLRGLSRVGIMFSGGVDSTLLAQLSSELGVDTTLYTVGREDSADFKFAEKIAEDMGLPLKLQTVTTDDVRDYLPLVVDAIEELNLMKLGVGMPAYIAAEMAHQDGLKVMLSGQGADELFAGYHRYLKLYMEKGEEAHQNLEGDVYNLYHVNLQRDDAVSMASGVELRVPFLDLDVINIAMNIPMKYKIQGEGDQLRKCILREVALNLGVPEESARRPKKAAQYGSGIDKMLRRVLKEEDVEDYLFRLAKSGNIQL